MSAKTILPIVIRYIIMAVASALATRGWVSPEQNTVIGQNADVIVGALVALGTVVYALAKRPSDKAMEIAKQVDKKVPTETAVFISTPPGVPDILVEGTETK